MINRKLNSIDVIICVTLFILTSTVYIHNLSTGIYGGDSGDFVTAILTRGIPHPSGYPLYTLLGILFSFLSLTESIVWKISLVSALISSLSVIVMYLLVKEITKNKTISLIGSLLLAFFYPFWIYAEVPEIFALHSFFVLVIVYLVVLYLRLKSSKVLCALFLAFGLSLTNNEISILLLPAIILLLMVSIKTIRITKRDVFLYAGCFIVGLLPYVYIPLASLHHPAINWEHTNTLQGFLDLVSRQEYGWRLTKSATTSYTSYSLGIYFTYISLYLNPFLLLLSLCGIGYLVYRKQYTLTWVLFAVFLCLGPVFVIVSRFPLGNFADLAIMQRFYIASLLLLIVFLSLGILGIAEGMSFVMNKSLVSTSRRNYTSYILLFFLIIPLLFFMSYLAKTNFSKIGIGDMFAQDLLMPLPIGSTVYFSTDTPVFNALYVQFAKNVRKDIRIPGENRGQKLAPLSPEMLLKQEQSTPIFLEQSTYAHFKLMPYGLVYKIASDADRKLSEEQYIAAQSRILHGFHLSIFAHESDILADDLILYDIKQRYVQAFLATGVYIKKIYNDSKTADLFFSEASKLKQN